MDEDLKSDKTHGKTGYCPISLNDLPAKIFNLIRYSKLEINRRLHRSVQFNCDMTCFGTNVLSGVRIFGSDDEILPNALKKAVEWAVFMLTHDHINKQVTK